MRRLLRVALTALGWSELTALVILAPLLHWRHMAVYHWTGTAGALFGPAFADVALLWGAMTLVLLAAERWPRVRTPIWVGILLLTPWVAATEWAMVTRAEPRHGLLAMGYAGGLAVLLAAAAWGRSFAFAWSWAVRFASIGLVMFGVGGGLLLGQLGWFAWQARGLNEARPMAQVTGWRVRPRIVWIVFDELSYQQVYERRFAGLKLPAFDALAAESTVFTNVVPAGIFTDSVLPALMTGLAVDEVRSSAGGALWVHRGAQGGWLGFDAHRTVFQDALDEGYRTAVVGWYVPYCRLLPEALERCVVSYEISNKTGMSPASSVWGNMLHPVADVAAAMVPRFHGAARDTTLHIADYERLKKASVDVLADPSVSFMLLHLPVPHLGGIYDRATGEMTTGPATYLDNLSLADRCLGELRRTLEKRGEWDNTTVVLMGDHSWRTTPEFKAEAGWSTEEEKASHGGIFDPRPAYVVKLPGQHDGAAFRREFSALRTRALLDGLMRGEITSSEGLAAWAGGGT